MSPRSMRPPGFQQHRNEGQFDPELVLEYGNLLPVAARSPQR
jgi:hypothetical protein